MASVTGGLFHPAAAATHVAATGRPDAGPLSLASATAAHTTISGGAGTVSGATAGSGAASPQEEARFAGAPAGTEQVAAAQTQEGGNTVLHLPDGSTITLVGVTHVDASFIH